MRATHGLYAVFMPQPLFPIEPLCRSALTKASRPRKARLLLDMLVLLLGTGGIVLMAGYAALCDHI